MSSLWDRMRERKVVQWALAYLAGGWLVLQVVDMLDENLGWPAWVFRVTIALLVVGFLAALVLAWYHGEQGRQRVSGVEVLMLAGILVLAGAAVTLARGGTEQGMEPAGAAVEEDVGPQRTRDASEGGRSIAVLPFDNLSPDPDNAYFADGIHDEILSELSKISGMKVISRTSVLGYRDSGKDVPTIAGELGVNHVMEGTVRKAGDRVRITTQLIDARLDDHLWTETYDRELVDIFAIQGDVARRVARSLEATLSPEEESRLGARPTESLEAYDAYLRGNILALDEARPTSSRLPLAVELYERAVDLDPEFALAHAALSNAHSIMYWWSVDRSEERCAVAKEAAERAVEIDPAPPRARRAMGMYHYRCHRDYAAALQELEIAQRAGTQDAALSRAAGYVHRRLGGWTKALEQLETAVELDPRHVNGRLNFAQALSQMRRYAEAERHYDRVIALAPDAPIGHAGKAQLQVDWRGDVEGALEIMDEAERFIDPERLGVREELLPYAGRFRQALALLEAYVEPSAVNRGQMHRYPWALRYGDLYYLLEQPDSSRKYLEMALPVLEELRREDPEWYGPDLGRAYAGLGRTEHVLREGERVLGLMPYSRDALSNPHLRYDVAANYVMVGEVDRALDQIEFVLSVPGTYSSPHRIRLNPWFRPLRDHPRFQALLEEHESVQF